MYVREYSSVFEMAFLSNYWNSSRVSSDTAFIFVFCFICNLFKTDLYNLWKILKNVYMQVKIT